MGIFLAFPYFVGSGDGIWGGCEVPGFLFFSAIDDYTAKLNIPEKKNIFHDNTAKLNIPEKEIFPIKLSHLSFHLNKSFQS